MAKDLSINTTYLSDTKESLNVAREKYCNASSSTNTSSSTSSKTTTTAKENFKESQLEAKNNTSSSNSSKNNTNTNTSSSSVNKATEALNSLNEDIKKDYSNVINDLNNYIEKANDLENKLSNAAKNELSDKDTTKSGLPKMTTTINNSSSSNIASKDEFKFNQLEDKSSTYNKKNINISAKEKLKESQIEERTSINNDTNISQNLKNVEKRIEDIDTKNSYNINNSKSLTNSEISSRLGYVPGTELAIQEYSKEMSKKINNDKSASSTSSLTNEVPQQKSVREYLQAGPQWSYSDKPSINGYDVITGAISATEGVATFGEDIVKGATLLGAGAITAFDGITSLVCLIWDDNSLSAFNNRNNQRWNDVGTFVSTDYVSTFYDNIYESTGLKDNASYFDTVRSVGKGVGYIGASLVTGGAVSGALGVTAGTTTASLINAGIYGTARFGGATGEALQSGASTNEALLYGGLTGLKEATGMFIGSRINQFTPFGTGTSTQVLANSASHVTLDGGLGVVSTLLDTSLKTVYTPRNKLNELGFNSEEEWNNASFSQKYDSRFNEIGGWSTVGKNAMVGMAFSSVFEGISAVKQISDMNKDNNGYSQVQQNNND